MALIDKDQFINKFEIHVNGANVTKLTEYINRYEEKYLTEMLGKELYNLFKLDLTATTPQIPQTQRFIDIYNAFSIESTYQYLYCDKLFFSRGMADMIIGFIYWEYQRDAKVQQTINSAVKIKSENSSRPYNLDLNIFGRYNESIDSYKAIQQYCLEKYEDYPEFKGYDKGYAYLSW